MAHLFTVMLTATELDDLDLFATAMSHVLDDGISCAQMLSELFGEGITEE